MISFNAILPVELIISVLLVFGVLFLWLEWRRKQSHRSLRIIAVGLMTLALAGIFLRPAFTVEKSSSTILLTENYNRKKVDSLLQLNRGTTLKHLEGVKSYRGSKPISISDLSKLQEDIPYVVGEGLPNHVLDLFDHNSFQFIPSNPVEGITQLYTPDDILSNRKNTINGLNFNTSGKTLITLKGPAGVEDSVSIEKAGHQPFSLSFHPKLSGKILYELIFKNGEGDTRTEILPLHIDESRPLRILFLQSYPTFETQYLKNFLTAKGHQLVLRYQLSKNNFRFEYGNQPSQQFSSITHELLNRFDLVLIDANELQTSSASERAALQESVQQGLGMLILNFDPSTEVKGKANIFSIQVQKVKTDTTSLQGSNASFTLPALPYRMERIHSVKSILENKSGILSGYRNVGLGKIGFQFLQQTYQLTLAGDSLGYSNLWSPVIENISKRNVASSKIKITTPFPIYQDEPIDFEIISSVENPVLEAESIQIPLQEDVLLDNVWHGRIWAGEPGWHTLKIKDGTSLDYSIQKTSDWRSLSVANQIYANQLAGRTSEIKNADTAVEFEMINPVFFYLLFVLASGFLWIAPKI